jgi:hypothetical protein
MLAVPKIWLKLHETSLILLGVPFLLSDESIETVDLQTILYT